jgi:hypothetical protein
MYLEIQDPMNISLFAVLFQMVVNIAAWYYYRSHQSKAKMPGSNAQLRRPSRVIVACENLKYPTNLGQMARTACCLGVDQILFSPDPGTRVGHNFWNYVHNSSQQSSKRLDIVQMTRDDLQEYVIQFLKADTKRNLVVCYEIEKGKEPFPNGFDISQYPRDLADKTVLVILGGEYLGMTGAFLYMKRIATLHQCLLFHLSHDGYKITLAKKLYQRPEPITKHIDCSWTIAYRVYLSNLV